MSSFDGRESALALRILIYEEDDATVEDMLASGLRSAFDLGLAAALAAVQSAEDAYMTREHDDFSEGATEGAAFARNEIERLIRARKA